MAKSARRPTPAHMPVNRVRIRLLWKLLEIDGEGVLSVIGALVICLLMVGWLILR
jgi:hypothetical protein